MANTIEPRLPDGKKIPRGVQLKIGRGWRLITPEPSPKRHKAVLIKKFSVNSEMYAIFHVLKK
ncbi:MAG TPA: hypothetical protein VNZ47_13690 [Candidatus Dormibacteraeota bacterium]|jgi:hypothetical protein|nr:hypothetical protein [Candidatus Dormibacteraeota bacterium]